MPIGPLEVWPAVAEFALAAALTPLVRALARRLGLVAKPRADRWHKQPTALLGGVALFLAAGGVYLVALPHTPATLALLGGAALVWLVGLIDDLFRLRPY